MTAVEYLSDCSVLIIAVARFSVTGLITILKAVAINPPIKIRSTIIIMSPVSRGGIVKDKL